jgi:hypothetical protein
VPTDGPWALDVWKYRTDNSHQAAQIRGVRFESQSVFARPPVRIDRRPTAREQHFAQQLGRQLVSQSPFLVGGPRALALAQEIHAILETQRGAVAVAAAVVRIINLFVRLAATLVVALAPFVARVVHTRGAATSVGGSIFFDRCDGDVDRRESAGPCALH